MTHFPLLSFPMLYFVITLLCISACTFGHTLIMSQSTLHKSAEKRLKISLFVFQQTKVNEKLKKYRTEKWPTVVVFIRPPGCVQVQPDLLISKSQPSPSKHGSISHHCFVLIIRAMEQKRKKKNKTKNNWQENSHLISL